MYIEAFGFTSWRSTPYYGEDKLEEGRVKMLIISIKHGIAIIDLLTPKMGSDIPNYYNECKPG
jgi:hypothetical protein